MTIRDGIVALMFAIALSSVPQRASADDSELITKPSKYLVPDTIERLEVAVKAKGWVVFTEVDHAAAAAKVGLELRPGTVVVIDGAIADRLASLALSAAYSLSIRVDLDDTARKKNDRIRGAGVFDRTVRAIRLLHERGCSPS